jgi:hypothetical protein
MNGHFDYKQTANAMRAESRRLWQVAEQLDPQDTGTAQPQTSSRKKGASATVAQTGERKRTGARKMSPESRAKIAAAQKARWDKQRQTGSVSGQSIAPFPQ